MKRKFILTFVVLVGLVSFDFNAATIYSSDGTEVTDTKDICANNTYSYKTATNGMYEADIVDADNYQLVATSNSQNGEIELTFPSKAGSLVAYIYEYKDQTKTLIDTYKFTVSDCGYDEVVYNYKPFQLQTTIKKTDTGYQFSEPKIEEYNLYINQIEANDDGTSKRVKFKQGVGEVEKASDVIQLTEDYVNKEGKKIENFYEVDFSNAEVIREISDVQLKVIKPMQYIDRKILIRVVSGFIVLVVLYLLNRIFIKQYRARKQYLKKYKKYQEKRIAAEKKKKMRELELKKRKQEAIKKKRLESERRANLAIRK